MHMHLKNKNLTHAIILCNFIEIDCIKLFTYSTSINRNYSRASNRCKLNDLQIDVSWMSFRLMYCVLGFDATQARNTSKAILMAILMLYFNGCSKEYHIKIGATVFHNPLHGMEFESTGKTAAKSSLLLNFQTFSLQKKKSVPHFFKSEKNWVPRFFHFSFFIKNPSIFLEKLFIPFCPSLVPHGKLHSNKSNHNKSRRNKNVDKKKNDQTKSFDWIRKFLPIGFSFFIGVKFFDWLRNFLQNFLNFVQIAGNFF